ncbi:MAG TPA: hypothetical protein VG096_10465 [Bryobacteraceae bacterium]|jgi:hypothetical protein|nr:hypothetical protein [Bryobacteraceae bacterium]
MKHRSTIRKRLERLETAQQKGASAVYREAFVEICPDCPGERHVVMIGSNGIRSFFQETPGPGPQLSDFGEFAFVLDVTPAEMDA